MRTILFAFLLWPGALYSQVTFSNFVVDGISYSSARVSWITDVVTIYSNVEWDTQATPPLANRGYPKTQSTTLHGKTVSGLPSNARIYCRAYGTSGGTVYYSAVSSFQTPPAPADPFTPPDLPNEFVPPTLTTFAAQYTVSSCNTLVSTINTAASAGKTGNVRVLIDPSLDCSFSAAIQMPNNTNTGYVQIRSAAADSALPPPGVRITPAWAASMPKLRSAIWDNVSVLGTLFYVNGPSRYMFGPGLYISESNVLPTTYVKPITAVDAGVPITYTSPAHGFTNGNILQIREVTGVTGANAPNCKVIGATADTFQCKYSWGTGTYISGGWAVNSASVPWVNWFFLILAPATDVVIDRCVMVIEKAPPVAMNNPAIRAGKLGGSTTMSQRVAAINSYIDGLTHWRSVDPDTGTYVGMNGLAVAVDYTGCSQCTLQNTYVNAPGISVFIQGSDGLLASAQDVVIRRNLMEWDEQWWLSGPSSNGMTTLTRQALEFKNCVRGLIEGNVMRNHWNGGDTGNLTYQNYMVATLSDGAELTNSVNQISHLTHRYNTIYNSGGAFTMRGKHYYGQDVVLGRKHLYHDNLVYGIDPYTRKIPTAAYSYSPFMYFMDANEGVEIRHNTAYDLRGVGPAPLLMIDADAAADFRMRDNLFVLQNRDGGYKGISWIKDWPVYTPPIYPFPDTTSNLTTGSTYFGSNGHTFDFSNNVFVPGTLNSSSAANYNVTSGAAYLSVATSLADWAGLPATVVVGQAGESANQRAARIKFFSLADGDFRLRHDSPVASSLGVTSDGRDAGADINALEAAQGKVRNARVVSLDRTSAVIGYSRPADQACTVEYGSLATMGTGLRVADSGGIAEESLYLPVTVTLSELQPGTSYNYRVLCPVEQPVGQFVTLP